MRWLPCAVLLLLPLAGCLDGAKAPGLSTTAQPPSPAQGWQAVNALLEDVPCEAAVGESPAESSQNLRLLSTLPIPASWDGTHGELDVRGDLVVHARFGSSGFEVYDIADPLHVRHLGNFTHGGSALDVKFSPDNQTVLVGTDTGIILADIRDPASVVQAGEWRFTDAPQLPLGPGGAPEQNAHMLATARIGGTDWVFLAPNSNTGAWVLRLDGPPEARRLTYVAQTAPVEGGPLGPHGLYVQKDAREAADSHWILYVADGFHGWTAFNVDDPARPVLAGGWVNPAEGAYTHSVQAQAINGRRIVATVAEIGANFLRVYDATNLRVPVLLGQWQANSKGVTTSGPSATHPQHNINIVAGTLFMAHYSYGLYAFNLTAFTAGAGSAAGPLTLQPVAHWAVGGRAVSDGPVAYDGYWDVVAKDGVLYVGWREGGLVVLGYGCHGAHLPDPALTSTG